MRVSLSGLVEDSRLKACDCMSLDSTAFIFKVNQSLLGLFYPDNGGITAFGNVRE